MPMPARRPNPVLQFLQGLPPRTRALGAGALGLLLAGWLAWATWSGAHAPQALHPVPVPQAQLVEMAGELTRQGIPFEVAPGRDGLLVAPGQRVDALRALEARGLPRTLQEEPSESLMMTPDERRAAAGKALEAELERSLRRLDGVADAEVKVARPDRGLFEEGKSPVTATVQLSLERGVQLTGAQVQGIAQMVAFSVPELAPENVSIVDRAARVLNPARGEAAEVPMDAQELQVRMEDHLTRRLQDQLDAVLGPDRALASVHVELDHSQVETERRIFGAPGQGGSTLQGVQEGSEALASGEDGRDYRKTQRAAKYAVNEAVIRSVQRLPRVSRTTCSVAVDNLSPEVAQTIERLAAASVGLDEGRGDRLEVVSLPFASRAPLEVPEVAAVAPAATAPWAPVTATLACATLLALAALRRRPQQPEVPRLEPAVGVAGPVDLLTTRTSLQETRVHPARSLQEMEPRRLAEALKETWLQ